MTANIKENTMPVDAIISSKKPARLYPWLMALLVLFMLMVTNGFTTTSITGYDESLLKEFGWSRGQLKFRDLITLCVAGLAAPFAGALIDRVGVRKLMLIGSLLMATAYYSYGHITSLAQMYLIHAVFGVALVCAGILVAVIHVSQWFVSHRGTAIGIALVGSSLGGVVFTPVVVALITSIGWRATFEWMSLFNVVLFFLCFWLARSPAEMGQKPLGFGEISSNSSLPASPGDVTYAQALRTVSFWALATVAMTTFYSLLALAGHLFLHLRGLGWTPQAAGMGISILFTMGLISKFLFGLLVDYFNMRTVFFLNILVMLIGLILLATQRADLIWPAIVVTGFGWGGLYTLLQLQTVNNFGLTHSGKILGTITLMDAIAGGLGIWLTGVLFDRFNSYEVAFYLLVGLLSLALIASTKIKREIKLP